MESVRRRWTNLSSRQQSATFPSFETALAVEAVREALRRCGRAVALDDSGADKSLDDLTAEIRAHAPEFALFFGDRLKHAMASIVLNIVLVEAGRDDAADVVERYLGPLKSDRVTPHNPLRLGADNEILGVAAVTDAKDRRRFTLQVLDYVNTTFPARDRGRPPGRAQRIVRRPTLDPQVCEQGLRLKETGHGLLEIAGIIGIPFDPYDAASKQRARGLVRARIERGRINRERPKKTT